MDERQVRGYSILAKGDEPKLINQETFLVPSQSSSKKYKVVLRNEWVCECPDFLYRKQKCKHIYAVEFLLKLRNKLDENSNLDFAEEIKTVPKCQFCGSKNCVKNGNIKNKTEKKQRFWCRACNKTFFLDSEFNYVRNPKVIMLTIDLYMKGLSLRKITDTLNQFFGVKIHHETVRRWILKFTSAMNEYVNKLKPEVSDAWHVDEQMIKIKGRWEWCWNALDEQTRFLIANNITKERSLVETRQIFAKTKLATKTRPEFIITDGLPSYRDSIIKEFHSWRKPQVNHVRLESIRSKRLNNNLVERYHSTFRERDKVMRGFKSENTARKFAESYRTYYNFVRPHQALKGMTPSQMADLDLKLDRNRWMGLLKQSLKK